MGNATDTVTWQQFAGVLAAMPDVYRKLLAEHTAAPCGRCRTCTRAGTGTPGKRWPCPTYEVAALAQQIHDEWRGS